MSLPSEDREPFRLSPIKALTPDDTDLFAFGGSVGPNGENRREDVIKAQLLLGETGDYDFGRFDMPTGWPSGDLYRGIKKFQKRNGMDADGTLLPVPLGGVDQYGVGETVHALRSTLGEHFAGQKVPTPKEVDAHYEEQAKRLARGEEPPVAINRGLTLSDEPPAQPPQAKPGKQVAFAPAAVPIVIGAARAAPAIVNLLRGAAGALAGGAAA